MMQFMHAMGFLAFPLMIVCLVLMFTGQRTRQRLMAIVILQFVIAFCSVCGGSYINAAIWGIMGIIGANNLRRY
jgi:hypothetical protein